MTILAYGIVLHGVAFVGAAFGVDPGVVVFPLEAIASHKKALEEAVFAHSLEGIGGRGREEVATGAVGLRDIGLVEADKGLSQAGSGFDLAGGGGWACHIGVLAPRGRSR